MKVTFGALVSENVANLLINETGTLPFINGTSVSQKLAIAVLFSVDGIEPFRSGLLENSKVFSSESEPKISGNGPLICVLLIFNKVRATALPSDKGNVPVMLVLDSCSCCNNVIPPKISGNDPLKFKLRLRSRLTSLIRAEYDAGSGPLIEVPPNLSVCSLVAFTRDCGNDPVTLTQSVRSNVTRLVIPPKISGKGPEIWEL